MLAHVHRLFKGHVQTRRTKIAYIIIYFIN